MNYKKAFQFSLIGNLVLLIGGSIYLTSPSAVATPDLQKLRPAGGYLLRYFDHLLTLRPGDSVGVLCAENTPQWKTVDFQRPRSAPSSKQRYYYIVCPDQP